MVLISDETRTIGYEAKKNFRVFYFMAETLNCFFLFGKLIYIKAAFLKCTLEMNFKWNEEKHISFNFFIMITLINQVIESS